MEAVRIGGTRGTDAAARLGRAARVAAVLCSLVAAPLLAGCASGSRQAEFREFTSGRYAEARASYESYLAENGAEATLDRNLAGTAALMQGDVEGAHRHFEEAFTDLEDLTATTGETVAAIVGPERTKRWKGDAHERCMNAWYLGVTYWLKGDVDNAAASFRAGLLRDADSAEGAAQSDFAALWYMLGMAQKDARHTDGGAQAFTRAEAIEPALRAADAAKANVVVVVEAGLAPRKTAGGANGEDVVYRRRDYVTRAANVSVDGEPSGSTVRATDLYAQAVTRGGGTMDTVNEVKSVTKTGATVAGAVILDRADNHNERLLGAALLAAGLLMSAEADIRQWDTLPGEILVLPMRLPAGRHKIRVEPRDAWGTPVSGTWREFDVNVVDGRVAFLWMRSAPRAVGSADAGEAPEGSQSGRIRTRTGGRP